MDKDTMEDNTLTIEKVSNAINPLERKYGWGVEEVSDGVFEITVTDDSHKAKGEITSLDEVEELLKELEKEIDGQDYPTIG